MDYRELINAMTPEEKASLCSGKDFWQTRDIERLGIPSMFLADGPNGIRKQAAAADHLGLNESLKATCFPTSATVANSWDTELGEETGAYLGREAVAQKVNVVLGPGLNIKRNPLCGRNFEYFSEDPYLSGKMAAAYVRGIQQNGVAACIKHFAANNQELRRMVIDTVADERTLREIYLTAFEIAVKEGKTRTVMSSYNKLNGEYTNEHMHLMRDILRGEWGYKGVVVTDWGGGNDRVKGLRAGNELEMPTTGGETNRDIVSALKSGELNEEVLDECLERLLSLIFETEEVYKKERRPFDAEKHHEAARRAAEGSVVLLKNRGGILPLRAGEKVAVIGDFARYPRFQGSGSSNVNPTRVDKTIELIEDSGLNFVGFAPGFKRNGRRSAKLLRQALALAEKADTLLLYIGLDEDSEIEGLDRRDMKLPQNQLDLISALGAKGKRTAAVLSCGAAVETDWDERVDAVIHTCLSGQAGAGAALDVLTGKVNPSGKLAESFPVRYEDCSSASNFPGRETSVEYREGLYVGYRYYDTAEVPVKYPFGFGLSYTSFEYGGLTVTDEGAVFSVANTGAMAGAEVAQLYVGAKDGKVFRPKKELKGFVKVRLEPGERKTVTIPFDEYTFRYYNPASGRFETEPCAYAVYIGASSADMRLEAEHRVSGEDVFVPYNARELPSYYSGKAAGVSQAEFEKLLGKKVPDARFSYVKKNRITVDYYTTVMQLRHAKGWSGRLFARGVSFLYRFLKLIGKHRAACGIMIGLFHQPMRGISRMSGGIVKWGQLDGMIMMFNGRFFKGLGKFIGEGRKAKRLAKAEKKKAPEAAKK